MEAGKWTGPRMRGILNFGKRLFAFDGAGNLDTFAPLMRRFLCKSAAPAAWNRSAT
jgi:hypothetical protein